MTATELLLRNAIPRTILPATREMVAATEIYTVKGVKRDPQGDVVYYTASLYRGTKRVATLRDHYVSGDLDLTFLNDTDGSEQSRFHAWIQDCLAVKPTVLGGLLPNTVNLVISDLMEEARKIKTLNADERLRVVDPKVWKRDNLNEMAGSAPLVYGKGVSITEHGDQILAFVGPDAHYWDRTEQTWKRIADTA